MTENLTRVTVTCLVAIFVAAVLATAYVNQGSTSGPDMTPRDHSAEAAGY